MKISKGNLLLSALLVVVIAGSMLMRVDYSVPNIEIMPDMKYSPASDAYASNSIFANGRTLQAQPAGTIARGQIPLHFAATKADALRAGEELHSPYRVSPLNGKTDGKEPPAEDAAKKKAAREKARQDSVRRGRSFYKVFCVACHGAGGAGDGIVAKRGFPPPPSLLTGKSRQMKDGQLFHVLTYGQQTMPSMAAQISPDRRWDVISFIRDMQAKAPVAKGAAATSKGPSTPPAESRDDSKDKAKQ